MEQAKDQAVDIRKGEELPVNKLLPYLQANIEGFGKELTIRQFPSGFSNLTYLLRSESGEYVLRKPPHGANIKSAHDMGREFKVLSLLKPVYAYVPAPLCYEDTGEVLGTPFYVMERVEGIILRNKAPKGLELSPDFMRSLSEATTDHLAELHQLDIHRNNLKDFGKPEGYIQRQVEGWTRRYQKAATDDIGSMSKAAAWMLENLPKDYREAFIHNDYKYDNLVLSLEKPHDIKAVLDWEMATVGDPLMDLGTSLAYWGEANDHPALKPFSLTWLEGNLTREEVVARYFQKSQLPDTDMLFYYVFGAFKVGVIAQQIYARYQQGFTKDERFGALIHVVKACGRNAQQAIQLGKISGLY